MRILPVSTDAMLLEFRDLPQTLAWLAALQRAPMTGVLALLPAARTILLRYQPWRTTQAALIAQILGIQPSATVSTVPAPCIEIPVCYDGEDLEDVARTVGVTPQTIIDWHTGACYTVAFTGFAPGFAYLTGGHPRLHVPRRQTPRTRIPAGSVALAGGFSGVYPQASPGGWQLIGRTDAPMWDVTRASPALLRPGDQVRFVACATLAQPTARACGGFQALPASEAAPALRVRQAGLQMLIQDLGRAGRVDQGLSSSGAVDRAALRAANQQVGNPADAAGLEVLQGGVVLESVGPTVLAVGGAMLDVTRRTADGRSAAVAGGQAVALDDGDCLQLGAPRAGLRSYVAVRGGVAVPAVLGSSATDTLAQVGPRPLQHGDLIPVGVGWAGAGVVDWPAPAPPALPVAGATVVLDVVLGPRTDWFTPDAVLRLCETPWQVTTQSNRIGMRLQGQTPLTRTVQDELPSEGTIWGAIQVPPDGQPVLFLADHPLTGGYPVIATVADYHRDLAGQIPPGAMIRFRALGPFAPLAQRDES